MTQAVLSNGSQVGFDTAADSPHVFAPIAEVLSIGEVGVSNDTVDVTNLDSSFKEYIGGLQDGVSFPIEFNWINDTTQTELRTAVASNIELQVLVVFSDGSKAEFTATPEGWSQSAESGTQLTATATLKISGEIDFATTAIIT